MPDHFHMLWTGISEGSNQLRAMKHFRKSANQSLQKIGFEIQDQAYDHVLTDEELKPDAFWKIFEYIAENPIRAELVGEGEHGKYPFTGCLVPGYPELRPFNSDFHERFDRIISFIRKEGLTRT